MSRIGLFSAALVASAGLLASCSSEAEVPEVSASAEQIEAQTLSLEDFPDVAFASCDLAFAQGVEEVTVSGNYRQVMIPKEAALNDYSAAWEDIDSGEVGLIWEADAFLSCAPAMTLSLAQEAGEEPAWEITATEAGYTVFQDFGEYGTQTIEFGVVEGIFVAAKIIDGEEFEMSYTPDLEESLQLISQAVAEFEQ